MVNINKEITSNFKILDKRSKLFRGLYKKGKKKRDKTNKI